MRTRDDRCSRHQESEVDVVAKQFQRFESVVVVPIRVCLVDDQHSQLLTEERLGKVLPQWL